jgi:redox-sensitive bicupin YhaK (pirin superfamily)
MHGFQLWINLPAARKMIPAAYQDIPAANIPLLQLADGVTVKVIAGEYAGQPGSIQQPDTEPLYLDVHVPAGQSLDVAIPAGHNAFLYLYQGSLLAPVTQQVLAAGHMAILSAAGDGVTLRSEEGARVLVLAGKPLQETIAQYGPFVMNTRAELEQAFDDYQQGRLA